MLYGANAGEPGRRPQRGHRHRERGPAPTRSSSRFSRTSSTRTPPSAIEHVPSGLVQGVVTDANDGEPISGATVTADAGRPIHDHRRRRRVLAAPAARLVHDRGERDQLRVRLRPGHRGRRRRSTTLDFALDAAVAAVEPTEINETVDFGETTDVDVTLSNTGSAPLDLGGQGARPGGDPARPPAGLHHGDPAAHLGAPADPRRRSRASSSTTPAPVPLSLIIDDPEATRSTRTTSSRSAPARTARRSPRCRSTSRHRRPWTTSAATSTSTSTRIHRPACPPRRSVRPADPGHRHGVLRRPVRGEQRWDRARSGTPRRSSSSPWSAPSVDGQTIAFDMPLEALGGDDGSINTAMVTGQFGPSDWAPDEGHGTIEPFVDCPVAQRDARVGHDRTRREPGRDDPSRDADPAAGRVPRRRSSSRPTRRSRPSSRSTSRSPSRSRRSSAP